MLYPPKKKLHQNKSSTFFFQKPHPGCHWRPWRVEFPFHLPQGTCWRSSIVDCWQWEGRACNPAIHPLFFRYLVERKDSLVVWCLEKQNKKTCSHRPLGSMGLYGIFSYMKGWLIFFVNIGKYTIHPWIPYGKFLWVFFHGEQISSPWESRGFKCRDPKSMVKNPVTHTIHVWYIYLHLPYKSTIHVGKYTSPMDPMGHSEVIRSHSDVCHNEGCDAPVNFMAPFNGYLGGSSQDSDTWLITMEVVSPLSVGLFPL